MFLRSLILVLALCAVLTRADNDSLNDPICECEAGDTCCHIDTSHPFTGKTIVQFEYPKVSYSGNYTLVNFQDASTDTNTSLPFQYVVKYENTFRSAFGYNVIIFSDDDTTPINCEDSFVFYGSPDDSTSKKISMAKYGDVGSRYCMPEINYKLTRDEIATTSEIYFAFNDLVVEGSAFSIMYDMSDNGAVVPESDINDYPYLIVADSVTATDKNEGTDFYIDIGLNVRNISQTKSSESDGEGCIALNDLFNSGNAYWYVNSDTKCDLDMLSIGSEDAASTDGREYHIKIDQSQYETCSRSVDTVGSNLVFSFMLVFPRDYSNTDSTEDNTNCLYFNRELNVQNFTVTMAKDVTDTVTSEYVTNFNVEVEDVEPERATDLYTYPTPYSRIQVTLKATFPSIYGIDFNSISIPTLGESSDYNTMIWNDGSTGTVPTYSCNTFEDPAGDGDSNTSDDYTECLFYFVSSVYEPTYETTDGQCAFERNTTRFLYGFQVQQLLDGGLVATYTSSALNLGIDYTEWDAELCDPVTTTTLVNVNDYFEVDLNAKNFFNGVPVDWSNTSTLSMNDDFIVRLRVGQTASTPFDFTEDLSLMIKTVVAELRNPLTGALITSYTFSVSDKNTFMHYSYTPYFKDPRFCTWYDSTAESNKCEKFFDIDEGRTNTYHSETWITETMPLECQEEGTMEDEEDSNNSDFFLFNPVTWFTDNSQGYVQMTLRVTGTVQQCDYSNSTRRALAESSIDPDTDVLYISYSKSFTFNSEDDDLGDDDFESDDDSSIGAFFKKYVVVISVCGSLLALIPAVICVYFLIIKRRNPTTKTAAKYKIILDF